MRYTWTKIQAWIEDYLVDFLKGAAVVAFIVVVLALLAEAAMTLHFEREFAREHGYYPTKVTMTDNRSE